MEKKNFRFSYEVYESIDELEVEDGELLREARNATRHAYAPYSQFQVGASARLANGQLLTGANEENASFPAGICAERVLLSAISSQYPGTALNTMAISYHNAKGPSSHPIFPCGICRQSFQEYEHRYKKPIRLVLSGMQGGVFIISQASLLLPLAFTSEELD